MVMIYKEKVLNKFELQLKRTNVPSKNISACLSCHEKVCLISLRFVHTFLIRPSSGEVSIKT